MAEAKITIGPTYRYGSTYYITCRRCPDIRVFPIRHTPLSHVVDVARDHLFHAHGVQHQERKPRTFERMLIDAHAKNKVAIAERAKKGVDQ